MYAGGTSITEKYIISKILKLKNIKNYYTVYFSDDNLIILINCNVYWHHFDH